MGVQNAIEVWRMPNYRFKVHDMSTGSEKLGAAVLGDDEEALAFAQRMIRKLVQSDIIYSTGSVEITTGSRKVHQITFESGSVSRLQETG
jgi:hypothetical protein